MRQQPPTNATALPLIRDDHGEVGLSGRVAVSGDDVAQGRGGAADYRADAAGDEPKPGAEIP